MSTPSQPFRRQVLRNTLSSGAANAWAMVVGLVSVPLFLRGLGVDAFGIYVLLQTFSATNGWLSLADLGVVVATTREVASRAAAGDLDGVRRTATASLGLVVGVGGSLAAALAVAGPFVLPALFNAPDDLVRSLQIAIPIFAVQLVFDLSINSLEGSLEGLQRVDHSRMVDMSRRLLVIGSAAITALVTGSLVAVVAASAVATGAATLIAVFALRRSLGRIGRRPEPGEARDLLRYGRSIAVLRPLGVLQRTMDRLIVGAILGPAAVTLIEIATQLQAAAEAVLSATSYAVVPASSWLQARDDRRALAELAERGTRYSLLATLPVVTAVALLSASVVHLWVGPAYSEAAGLTTVAVLAVALAGPVAVGSQMLLGLGHAKSILKAAAVAIVVNLSASILLVHVVGLVGVFQATVLSALLLLPLLGRSTLRATDLTAGPFIRSCVLPVLPPVAAQAGVTALIVHVGMAPWPTLLLGGGLGLITFVTVARWTAVGADEIAEVVRLLRRVRPATATGNESSPGEVAEPRDQHYPGEGQAGRSAE